MPPAGQPGRPAAAGHGARRGRLQPAVAAPGGHLRSSSTASPSRPRWPELADDGDRATRACAPGEPFGLVGSSSLLWRDTRAGARPAPAGPRPLQRHADEASYGWVRQGADAGVYGDDDIYAVRILDAAAAHRPHLPEQRPQLRSRRRRAPAHPRRDPGAQACRQARQRPLDPDGKSRRHAASWPRSRPTPRSRSRRSTSTAWCSTWRRPGTRCGPGEVRNDCGGCHAHSQQPLDFETHRRRRSRLRGPRPRRAPRRSSPSTAPGSRRCDGAPAARRSTVEFFRDVRPILEARCASLPRRRQPARRAAAARRAARAPRGQRPAPTSPGADCEAALRRHRRPGHGSRRS